MAIAPAKAKVLNGPEDWYDWLDRLKDLATSKHVWNHVDPAIDAVPDLSKPSIPTIRDVKPDAAADATIMTLSEPERSALGILQRTYGMEYAEWQARDAALQHINDVIKATTGDHYQAYITGITTPHERLRALAKRVSPTKTTRYDDARDAYRDSLTNLRSTHWETWLHAWEKALKDGQRLEIPEVQGSYPTRDFVRAVATITQDFASVQEVNNNKLQTKGDDLPDALDIAAEWRNYMHSRKRSARGNAFGATLQGQGPDDKPKCVCGKKHWYSECGYIFPDLRPENWKPDPEVEKRIQNTITTNEKVRRNIERAKEKRQAAPSTQPPAVPSPAPQTGLVGATYKIKGLVA
jgi:hypothetical protein